MNLEAIKRVYRKLFKNPPKYKIKLNGQQERHGSVYGGWNILKNSIEKNSIIYSIGIGEDISFDLSIISKYGCNIYGFDPTPRVEDWLKTQIIPNEFIFSPFALSSKDGFLSFYSPENEKDISHKAIASKNSKEVKVKAKKLSSIMNDLGHRNIDLLKMDIEGFEYDVLINILEEEIFPKQLLIEFHHFFPDYGNSKTEDMIEILESNGYQLFNVSNSFCEYSFKYDPN